MGYVQYSRDEILNQLMDQNEKLRKYLHSLAVNFYMVIGVKRDSYDIDFIAQGGQIDLDNIVLPHYWQSSENNLEILSAAITKIATGCDIRIFNQACVEELRYVILNTLEKYRVNSSYFMNPPNPKSSFWKHIFK